MPCLKISPLFQYTWRTGVSSHSIYESGVVKNTISGLVAGTIFEIRRTGTTIEYLKNGAVIRTVTGVTTSPLLVDISMYYINTKIRNLTITNNGTEKYSAADVKSYSDYYPYGMQLPKRHGADGDYRYGFNGMEKDNEMKGGDGNSYDYGARLYDPRVGRWLSIDPLALKYPDLSPYNFCANSPIVFIDSDGEKFINPYTTDYNDAKLKCEKSEKILTEWLSSNPEAKKSDIKKYKETSGYNSSMDGFKAIESNYNDVEDLISTLKIVNRTEYDYFEGLKDNLGKEIEINIFLLSEGDPQVLPGSAHTSGLAVYSDESGSDIVVPTSSKGGINVFLNKRYVFTNSLGEVTNVVTGNNFRSFSNELGDIKYWFDKVKDKVSYKFWEETAAADSNPKDDKGYEDPEGAGEYSREYSRAYEKARKKEVDNYSVKDGEKKDLTKGTIKTIKE